jgi:hypothetical protein
MPVNLSSGAAFTGLATHIEEVGQTADTQIGEGNGEAERRTAAIACSRSASRS